MQQAAAVPCPDCLPNQIARRKGAKGGAVRRRGGGRHSLADFLTATSGTGVPCPAPGGGSGRSAAALALA